MRTPKDLRRPQNLQRLSPHHQDPQASQALTRPVPHQLLCLLGSRVSLRLQSPLCWHQILLSLPCQMRLYRQQEIFIQCQHNTVQCLQSGQAQHPSLPLSCPDRTPICPQFHQVDSFSFLPQPRALMMIPPGRFPCQVKLEHQPLQWLSPLNLWWTN